MRISPINFDANYRELIKQQFFVIGKKGNAALANDAIDFRYAMRFMHRHRILKNKHDDLTFIEYTKALLTLEQRKNLASGAYSNHDVDTLQSQVSSINWIEKFLSLNEEAANAWEIEYGYEEVFLQINPIFILTKKTLTVTKKMILNLQQQEKSILLSEFYKSGIGGTKITKPKALAGGLRYLLFYVSLSETLLPEISISPSILNHIHRDSFELHAIEPAEAVSLPPVMTNDMAQVLMFISEQSPRLKKEGQYVALFTKAEEINGTWYLFKEKKLKVPGVFFKLNFFFCRSIGRIVD